MKMNNYLCRQILYSMFSKIIIHKVGNKINQENLFLSESEPVLAEDLKEQLSELFLNSFKSDEQFVFYSDTYLSENRVYTSVSTIFEDPTTFFTEAESLAKHLYHIAENPRVQGGDLFVVYIEDLDAEESGNEKIDKIGIFKMEKKESFLKIRDHNSDVEVEKDFGISLNKIDKAALIYNKDKDSGYVVSAVDNNKNGDVYYWFEDFLKIKQREDDFFQTQETLTVYKDYITQQLPQEFEVSKADQADFLNKSINYFKEKQEFNFDDFAKEVLEDESVIESFSNFKTDYEQDLQVSISEDFPINNSAVKKQQKHFKSIIKLDKNFHIYIHGDRKMLETGADEKGKYYRLYFEKED